MNRCSFGFHDWAYSTRMFKYTKNGFVTDEREEVCKRTCMKCARVERNVGPLGRWVRVADSEACEEAAGANTAIEGAI
jgi:hypothetical protein